MRHSELEASVIDPWYEFWATLTYPMVRTSPPRFGSGPLVKINEQEPINSSSLLHTASSDLTSLDLFLVDPS